MANLCTLKRSLTELPLDEALALIVATRDRRLKPPLAKIKKTPKKRTKKDVEESNTQSATWELVAVFADAEEERED